MLKRSIAVLMLSGLLLVGAVATTAGAAEGGGEFTEYEEIVEGAGEAGGEFLPDEYEIPGFFDYIRFPLIALGVVVTGGVLSYYLIAQPRFQREAEEKSRR
ncbi:hypothetical protein [Euzebya tangerina]|uniref:hypothetical protein n=1 Tax=Euzebya tangerina TaxID=591198 RepID=UPI000E30C830|nr:hypothetical protein [Euzebya tangerina]